VRKADGAGASRERQEKRVPTILSLRSSKFLDVWHPVLCGGAVGLAEMLGALVAFGRQERSPELVAQLTQTGQIWIHPERDLPIYVAGCALTVLVIAALAWWKGPQIPAEGRALAWIQVALCGAALLLQVSLLGVLPLQPADSWPNRVLLFFPGLAALVVAGLGPRGGNGVRNPPTDSPAPAGSLLGGAAPPPWSWREMLLPVALVLLLFIPDWRQLAGRFFLVDEFHHWDYFAMGPTLALSHGVALGTDAYTQYGVGWPLVFYLLSPVLAISYGHMILVGVTYACAYFMGLYVLLRIVLGKPIWAAAGVFLAMGLHVFHGLGPDDVIWCWPSSTLLRSPMDVWFLLALALQLRTRRACWALAAGAGVGLALLFDTDTGLYLAAAWMGAWVLSRRCAGERPRSAPVLAGVGVAVAVALLGLAAGSRGTLVTAEFWKGWSEALVRYSGGVGALPIADLPLAYLLGFCAMVAVYLGALGVAVVRAWRRQLQVGELWLGVVAGYGLMTLVWFVGRSYPHGLVHVSVPSCLVAVTALARLHSRLERSLAGASGAVGRAVRSGVVRVLPAACLAAALFALWASPAFPVYPGLWVGSSPPQGFCLLQAPEDICGLPAELRPYAEHLHAVAARMRAAAIEGRTVAVLDYAGPLLYLMAGLAPWSRYSPVFPALLFQSEVVQLQEQLASSGPDVVVMCDRLNPAMPLGGWYRSTERDVWRAVHQTVQGHYRLESTFGPFEVWRRAAPPVALRRIPIRGGFADIAGRIRG
jgi:hypothetical protein